MRGLNEDLKDKAPYFLLYWVVSEIINALGQKSLLCWRQRKSKHIRGSHIFLYTKTDFRKVSSLHILTPSSGLLQSRAVIKHKIKWFYSGTTVFFSFTLETRHSKPKCDKMIHMQDFSFALTMHWCTFYQTLLSLVSIHFNLLILWKIVLVENIYSHFRQIQVRSSWSNCVKDSITKGD